MSVEDSTIPDKVALQEKIRLSLLKSILECLEEVADDEILGRKLVTKRNVNCSEESYIVLTELVFKQIEMISKDIR